MNQTFYHQLFDFELHGTSDLDPLNRAIIIELAALRLSKQGFLTNDRKAELISELEKIDLPPEIKTRRIAWINSLAGDILDENLIE